MDRMLMSEVIGDESRIGLAAVPRLTLCSLGGMLLVDWCHRMLDADADVGRVVPLMWWWLWPFKRLHLFCMVC